VQEHPDASDRLLTSSIYHTPGLSLKTSYYNLLCGHKTSLSRKIVRCMALSSRSVRPSRSHRLSLLFFKQVNDVAYVLRNSDKNNYRSMADPGIWNGGGGLPLPHLSSPSLSSFLLEVGPLNPARESGGAL